MFLLLRELEELEAIKEAEEAALAEAEAAAAEAAAEAAAGEDHQLCIKMDKIMTMVIILIIRIKIVMR